MSTTVFGEAARLYVENLDVVNEMRKAYERDADAMVAALEEAIEKELAPIPFRALTRGRSRYWWAGREEFVAGLWFYWRDPEHIDHTSLLLQCGLDRLNPARSKALAELPAKLGGVLDRSERVLQWSLCRMEIPFDDEFELAAAAKRIASALRAIAEVAEL